MIIDLFASRVWRILRVALADPAFDRRAVQVQILALLSDKPFATALLFRRFRADPDSARNPSLTYLDDKGVAKVLKLNEEANTYLYDVLYRRLTLANKQERGLTNMHILFLLLCQCGRADEGWHGAELARGHAARGSAPPSGGTLARVAAALKHQRDELGDRFGAISHRRRDEWGPIWLHVGACAAEMPEEISLADVLDALPIPLEQSCLGERQQKCLREVIKSLNDRYMLLRGCGLDPSRWLQRDTPPIGTLRELKGLRRLAGALNKPSREMREAAFRRAFESAKGERKQYADWKRFEGFLATEYGQEMLDCLLPTLDYPTLAPGDDGSDRRALLCGCGLDPSRWIKRNTPPASALRELMELRARAWNIIRHDEEMGREDAFRRAFAELASAGQYADCSSFEDFRETEHGQEMLAYPLESLDKPVRANDDGGAQGETKVSRLRDPKAKAPEQSIAWEQRKQEFSDLLQKRSELFSPAQLYLAREFWCNDRKIDAILRDAALRDLLRDDPTYRGLGPRELASWLVDELVQIINCELPPDEADLNDEGDFDAESDFDEDAEPDPEWDR